MSKDTNILSSIENAVTYCQSFCSEKGVFSDISTFLDQQNHAIQISPLTAQFLRFLVAATKPQKIVEVGTLVGYSALCLAEMLPKGGHIWTIERNPENIKHAQAFFAKAGASDKITCLQGEALDVLNELSEKGPFDMILIDADKAGYPGYLNWASSFLRKGGIVIGDNTLLTGAVYGKEGHNKSKVSTEAMQRFNNSLANSDPFVGVCLPFADGVTVAVKQ